MRYGNQRVQTAVVTELTRLDGAARRARADRPVPPRYGERFGEGSQSPEAGVRINTIRVCSLRRAADASSSQPMQAERRNAARQRRERRAANAISSASTAPSTTPIYGDDALVDGTRDRRTGDRHHARDDLPGRAGLAAATRRRRARCGSAQISRRGATA